MAKTYDQLSVADQVRVNAVLLNAFTEAFDETTQSLDADAKASVAGLDFAVLRRAVRFANDGGKIDGFGALRDNFRNQLAAQLDSLPVLKNNGHPETRDLAKQNALFELYAKKFAADQWHKAPVSEYVDIPDGVVGKDGRPFPLPEVEEVQAGQTYPPTIGDLINNYPHFSAAQRQNLYPAPLDNSLASTLPMSEPERRYYEFMDVLKATGVAWNGTYNIPQNVVDRLSAEAGPTGTDVAVSLYSQNLKQLKGMIARPDTMRVVAEQVHTILSNPAISRAEIDAKKLVDVDANDWVHATFKSALAKKTDPFQPGGAFEQEVISVFANIVNKYEQEVATLKGDGEKDIGAVFGVESLNLMIFDQMKLGLQYSTGEVTEHRLNAADRHKGNLERRILEYRLEKVEDLMKTKEQRAELQPESGLPLSQVAKTRDDGPQIV
ncbi:MAG: hypothetical protein MRY32_05125 [Rickettsiales bacterium]|nr:hypothetical protein [Rickettsiales bacterium]